MPQKNFLSEVIYPLLMRFFVVVIATVVLSLGLALVNYALEDAQAADTIVKPQAEIIKTAPPQSEPSQAVRVTFNGK